MSKKETHLFFNSSWKHATDAVIIVDGEHIPVSSELLLHLTKKFKKSCVVPTNFMKPIVIRIDDFSAETVKTTLDFCYNGGYTTVDLDGIFKMIEFAEKYKMCTFRLEVEAHLIRNLTLENFHEVMKRAMSTHCLTLLEECQRFYLTNRDHIKKTDEIIKLGQILYSWGFEIGKPVKIKNLLYTIGAIFVALFVLSTTLLFLKSVVALPESYCRLVNGFNILGC